MKQLTLSCFMTEYPGEDERIYCVRVFAFMAVSILFIFFPVF